MKYYKKLRAHTGIYKQVNTGKYMAIKRIDGEKYTQSFTSLKEARIWRKNFSGDKNIPLVLESNNATLGEVWDQIQADHFPILAESTRAVWSRRYELLKELEKIPMDLITPGIVTSWVERQVKYFRSEEYESKYRGNARRCNLDNPLNLLKTIFNWYQESEQFEQEAVNLTCPVKKKHKKLGFIRSKPIKDKKITLEHALAFFSELPEIYADFAKLQYFLAARVSEIVGLQWNRVDLQNRRIIIMETAAFHPGNKTFSHLNPHPKNKEPRYAHMTNEIFEILMRRRQHKLPDSDFVFHIKNKPMNYCTIQSNYKKAIRKADLPYSGTHILRHGMATLARKVGGGLDAVIAMTGHKDVKLADHYSKLDQEYQREISEKIMGVVREKERLSFEGDNVVELRR